ncbi:MAG: hypothetical protein ABIC68_08135 [Candidatus Omnitrophota bacterium]
MYQPEKTMKTIERPFVLLLAVLFSCLFISASGAQETVLQEQDMPFYVYYDTGSSRNHFYPSGWMGDWGEIKFNDDCRTGFHGGHSCIRVTYFAKGFNGAGWVGIYWQDPLKNWGTVEGGYNLGKARRLSFYARGERGGEVISEFKVGGITGDYPDSGTASIGPVVLTDQWQQYTIDLSDTELSHISGGFCWSTSRDANSGQPITFFLDDIRYE